MISAIIVWTDIMKSYSNIRTTICMNIRKINLICLN